jgi:hypothetical protein
MREIPLLQRSVFVRSRAEVIITQANSMRIYFVESSIVYLSLGSADNCLRVFQGSFSKLSVDLK